MVSWRDFDVISLAEQVTPSNLTQLWKISILNCLNIYIYIHIYIVHFFASNLPKFPVRLGDRWQIYPLSCAVSDTARTSEGKIGMRIWDFIRSSLPGHRDVNGANWPRLSRSTDHSFPAGNHSPNVMPISLASKGNQCQTQIDVFYL